MKDKNRAPELGRDGYEGISWVERSRLGILGAVLDPADKAGRKNAFIDTLQRSALRSALGSNRFNRALDFGCGTGRFLAFLANWSTEVVALDRTPEMLAIAREQYNMPSERFVCWRNAVLPFKDGYFDLVLSVYVLSIVPRADLERLVGEIARVCRPQAACILIEQVDQHRGIARSTWAQVLNSAGFEVTSAIPIRRSSSRFMRAATLSWWPRSLLQLLVNLEMALARSLEFQAHREGYSDYRFLLLKR